MIHYSLIFPGSSCFVIAFIFTPDCKHPVSVHSDTAWIPSFTVFFALNEGNSQRTGQPTPFRAALFIQMSLWCFQVSTTTKGGWPSSAWRSAQCQWKRSWLRPTWWRTCSTRASSASSPLLPKSQSTLSQSTWKMVGRNSQLSLSSSAFSWELHFVSIKRQGNSPCECASTSQPDLNVSQLAWNSLFLSLLPFCANPRSSSCAACWSLLLRSEHVSVRIKHVDPLPNSGCSITSRNKGMDCPRVSPLQMSHGAFSSRISCFPTSAPPIMFDEWHDITLPCDSA